VKLDRDGWTGLVSLAASLGLLYGTIGLKESPLVPVGPGFYPRIVLGITAVLAAALVFFSLRAQGKGPDKAEARNYPLVLQIFVICGVYAGLLPFVGFRIATLLFMPALQVSLEVPASRRQWIGVAVTALATTTVTYVVFEHYLHVLLPRGRWTDF
jgi:uncharacterized oligopeptide transporter (OPT) family protein